MGAEGERKGRGLRGGVGQAKKDNECGAGCCVELCKAVVYLRASLLRKASHGTPHSALPAAHPASILGCVPVRSVVCTN